MDKINFKNLPDETTPINATNLNTMQQNIENAINSKSSLPVGGNEGQILAKASNLNNDVEWIDNIGQGGGDTLPIGTIMPYTSDTIPNGWLLCDGSAFSASEYPELFDLIGVTYGWDENRNPLLPDMRGRVVVGKKAATSANDTEFSTLGKTGGEKEHTLTINEMPSHNHDIYYENSDGSMTIPDWKFVVEQSHQAVGKKGYGLGSTNTGGSQAHNNLQPYIVTNFIIKAKMTIVTNGEVIQANGTASASNVYSASAINSKLSTIVESGSNEEGNYIKYNDGTMICYGTKSFTGISVSDYNSFCKITSGSYVSFPATFISEPRIILQSKDTNVFSAAVGNVYNYRFVYFCYTYPNASSLTGSIDYIAIGRWKSQIEEPTPTPSQN